MEWIDVNDKLPELDEFVLVYYTIKGKDETHEYTEIARIETITISKTYKSVNWLDREYNGVEPLFWMPLPKSPQSKEGE